MLFRSEIQNPFFVFLLSNFSKTTPFFVKSPLRTLATAELFRIIGSNSSFHPPDCPRCEKPETARTAGRSGRAGGGIVPGSFSCYTLAVAKSCVSMQKFCMLNLGINTRLGDDIIVSCRQRTASFLLAVYPL